MGKGVSGGMKSTDFRRFEMTSFSSLFHRNYFLPQPIESTRNASIAYFCYCLQEMLNELGFRVFGDFSNRHKSVHFTPPLTTDKPTSFMMSKALVGITVVRKGRDRWLLAEPEERPAAFLKALGVSVLVFTDPRYQCTPITPRKPA